MEEHMHWLNRSYSEAPSDGPDAKRVKFSDIYEGLTEKFPSGISIVSCSAAIQEAFPNSQRKHLGKDRQQYVVGIEPVQELQEAQPDEQTIDPAESLRAENERLRLQVQQLQAQVKNLTEQNHLSSSNHVLTQQFDALLQQGRQVIHGPDTPQHFPEFSLRSVIDEIETNAPGVWKLFFELGDVERNTAGDASAEKKKAIMSLCTLLNARSQFANGIQLLLSFMLIARATSKQSLTVLNNAGVCMSYQRTWDYLRQLTTEAEYLKVIRTGHWLWVYDNVNLHQRVRHERGDKHSTMLNMTARLAIEMRNLPDWEVDWDDVTPQRDPATLTISDLLPGEADGVELQKRAVVHVMRVLVEEFPALSYLDPLLPTEESPDSRSNVVPMKILFKDEKYIAETTEILTRLATDAELSGKPEILIGDQLTCKIIRGAKRWRESDINRKDRLQWALEVPGDFHFLWECLKVLLHMYWGSPSHIGSLCNMREFVRRVQVGKEGKVFNVCDEFILHAYKSHLLAAICTHLHIDSPDSSITHESTLQWLEVTAQSIVAQILYPSTCSDTTFGLHRSFLHTAFLYVDLRHAIRFEQGEHIIRHWKLWLPRFLATGCKNYALEAAYLIVNITARFPKHIAYIAVHNRTVNMDGKKGHGKPLDQLMEHYNLVLKQALRTSGSNATEHHIEEVSLCSLFLMEAAKKADKEFGLSPRSSRHTTRDASADIRKIALNLLENEVTTQKTNRTTPQFRDLTEDGFTKMSQSWLRKILTQIPSPPEDTDQILQDRLADTNYELHHVV